MTKSEREENEGAMGGFALCALGLGAYAVITMVRERTGPVAYFIEHWVQLLVLLTSTISLVGVGYELEQDRRPKSRSLRSNSRAKRASDAAATPQNADAEWLEDLVDGYTLAPLSTSTPIYGCSQCRTLYGKASLQVIKSENHGRCPLCGGTILRRRSALRRSF